jgi:integrase
MKRLTAATCETAKPDAKRDRLLGDGDGLFLRVRPHGTKTWVVEYEHQGKRSKYTIGTYSRDGAPGGSISEWLRFGCLSLFQARTIAGSWKTARRGGHNPAAEWEALLAAERAAAAAEQARVSTEAKTPTVAQAVDIFMARAIDGKKSAPAIRYRLDRLAAALGDKKIRDVSRQDVIAALDNIAAGQRAGKTAKLLSGEVLIAAKRLWRFARVREWVEVSCIEELTRRDFDPQPTRRDVVLRLDELAAMWRVLGDREVCKADPVTVAAIRLLILTGQREMEVCSARWTEFDLEAGLWRIPAERTKSKRAHLVHLAPQAIAILEEMKSLNGRQAFVFASPIREGQPIYGRSVNNPLGSLFKSGKLPNVTPCHVHDFRRTLITRLPDLGFEPVRLRSHRYSAWSRWGRLACSSSGTPLLSGAVHCGRELQYQRPARDGSGRTARGTLPRHLAPRLSRWAHGMKRGLPH